MKSVEEIVQRIEGLKQELEEVRGMQRLYDTELEAQIEALEWVLKDNRQLVLDRS